MARLTFPIVRADSPDSDLGPSPPPTTDVGGAAPATPGVDAQECAKTLYVASPPPLPHDGDNNALPLLDSASESDHDKDSVTKAHRKRQRNVRKRAKTVQVFLCVERHGVACIEGKAQGERRR